jgi:hypothetical protein
VLGVELTRSGASQFGYFIGIGHAELLSVNNEHSRLSLLGQTAVQWHWVEGTVQTVAHVVKKIHTGCATS